MSASDAALGLVLGLLIASLLVSAVLLVAVVIARRRTRHPSIRLGPYWVDVGQEECTVCALDWVGKRDLHVIRETFAEPEFGAGAGTSMTAEYCAEHCPGGCVQEKEHVNA